MRLSLLKQINLKLNSIETQIKFAFSRAEVIEFGWDLVFLLRGSHLWVLFGVLENCMAEKNKTD